MISSTDFELEQLVDKEIIQIMARFPTQARVEALDILFNAAKAIQSATLRNQVEQQLKQLRELSDIVQWPLSMQKKTNQGRIMAYLVMAYKIIENNLDHNGYYLEKVSEVIQRFKKYAEAGTTKPIMERLKQMRSRGNNQFIQLLRLLPISEKQSSKFKNGLQRRQQQFAFEAIEHEMKRLYQNQYKKKGEAYPRLTFEKLNDFESQTITIFFSGFLSENSCKLSEWQEMISRVKTQAYAIRWESKKFEDILEYAKKEVVGPAVVAVLGYILNWNVPTSKESSERINNPFLDAFKMSRIVGQFLADFFQQHFKGYNLVLVGFSLGTQLIRNIMQRLQQRNTLNILKQVVLLGGVADHNQIERILQNSKHKLLVYNFYNHNDNVLKYLLWFYKSQLNPIGLNKIRGVTSHTIINQDCTDYIEGHTDYRAKMGIIADYVSFIYS